MYPTWSQQDAQAWVPAVDLKSRFHAQRSKTQILTHHKLPARKTPDEADNRRRVVVLADVPVGAGIHRPIKVIAPDVTCQHGHARIRSEGLDVENQLERVG